MIVGSGEYRYERVEGWAKYPPYFYFEKDLIQPPDMATDSKDRVFIFKSGNHPVIILDRDGNFVSCWGEGRFRNPHGICIGLDDSVYLVDCQADVVEKYTPDGKLLMTLGWKRDWTRYTRGEPFNMPTAVAVGPSGEILVSDGYANRRVHKFSPDGNLIKSWGEDGSGPGQFNTVHGVDVDRHGTIYVIDRENNHRIQVFTPEGEFVTQWTGFMWPKDLYIDRKNDTVYICEGQCGGVIVPKVSIRDLKGNVLAAWSGRESQKKGVLEDPHGIWLDSHGDIYIAENEPGPHVVKFAKVS